MKKVKVINVATRGKDTRRADEPQEAYSRTRVESEEPFVGKNEDFANESVLRQMESQWMRRLTVTGGNDPMSERPTLSCATKPY